jgi:hypothetical protein
MLVSSDASFASYGRPDADTIRDMMRPHQTDASSRLAAHGDGSYLS